MKTLALILMISLMGVAPAGLWAAPKKSAVEENVSKKKKDRRTKSKRKARRAKARAMSRNKSKAQVLNRDPVFQEGESLPPPQTPKDE